MEDDKRKLNELLKTLEKNGVHVEEYASDGEDPDVLGFSVGDFVSLKSDPRECARITQRYTIPLSPALVEDFGEWAVPDYEDYCMLYKVVLQEWHETEGEYTHHIIINSLNIDRRTDIRLN